MSGGAFTRVPHAGPADVAVWLVDLDAYRTCTALTGLGADEHARASRMRVRRDALRYLAARHALKRLVADAIGAREADIAITPDVRGKPRLEGEARVRFNASRSGTLALIGIANGHDIGVDVERLRPVEDAVALADVYFTPDERAAWRRAGRSDALFLACWTRKEACLKALGVGLSADASCLPARCTQDTRRTTVRVPDSSCTLELYGLELPCAAVGALSLA